MPKLLNTTDMDTAGIPGLSGYRFSAVRVHRLGASEYTLVTIACDVSGSVQPFRDLLVDTVKMAVDGCRKSPRAGNILLRVVTFNHEVVELHGFKPLGEVDTGDYERLSVGGGTALYDACAAAIGAMCEYGRMLAAQDFGMNGVLYVITDGEDNESTYGADMVRRKAEDAVTGEAMETFASVLIGVNTVSAKCTGYLLDFQRRARLSAYRDAGDATPGNMAKMAGFISRSVSSTAGALGSGSVPAAALVI